MGVVSTKETIDKLLGLALEHLVVLLLLVVGIHESHEFTPRLAAHGLFKAREEPLYGLGCNLLGTGSLGFAHGPQGAS